MDAIRVIANKASQVSSRTQPVRSGSNLTGLFIGDRTMRRIPLTQNKFALVDDENYEWLNQWKWCTLKIKTKIGNLFYATRAITQKSGKPGKRKMVSMHRQILGLKQGDGKQTDHQNHNGLDNREYNLRVCTQFQNNCNRLPTGGISKYKGVTRQRYKHYKSKWKASIKYNRKIIYLGYFENEIEAAKAYDKKAKELFGEFAYLNF